MREHMAARGLDASCCGAGRRCGTSTPPMPATSDRSAAMRNSTSWCFRFAASRPRFVLMPTFVEGWRSAAGLGRRYPSARQAPGRTPLPSASRSLGSARRASAWTAWRAARSGRLAAAQRLSPPEGTLAAGRARQPRRHAGEGAHRSRARKSSTCLRGRPSSAT